MGDQKPTKLLRRIQTLRGELHINDKLFKEILLERLPMAVQTVLVSGSEDLSVSRLDEMVDRMLEIQQFQPPSTSPLPTPNAHLVAQTATMTAELASLKLLLALLTSSRSPSRHRSRSRPRTADVCWYHTNFAAKAHQCSSPCSFKSPQENQSVRE
uniref:Uncharacterized protein n=2 Tax=Schistocephalus solidus TaxID=70667 RepID=A0A0X3NJT2_SCHSO